MARSSKRVPAHLRIRISSLAQQTVDHLVSLSFSQPLTAESPAEITRHSSGLKRVPPTVRYRYATFGIASSARVSNAFEAYKDFNFRGWQLRLRGLARLIYYG